MNSCIACIHWKLRNPDGKVHGMAQHKMGYCAHREIWRYFGDNHQCDNGKFTPVDAEMLEKRQKGAESRVVYFK